MGVTTRGVRGVARVLTGSTYALLGMDAFRTPGKRVNTAGPLLASVRRVAPLPEDDELLVRANAAAMVVAGTSLALGRLPRLSAAALLASMIPTTLAGHAFWDAEDPVKRRQERLHFLKNLSALGGLLIASVDTAGKPGLSWRARRAAKDASRTAKQAHKDARHAAHAARREAKLARAHMVDALPGS